MSHRLRLTLAYCGTPWRGWQRQPGGGTIQDEVETAVARIGKERVEVQGASRTDAGVHALGQVAHFDSIKCLPPMKWRDGLNAILPGTIRVLQVDQVETGFDACLNAVGKIYRYRIHRAQHLDPFLADQTWHLPGPLDLDVMRQAAARLIGTHNFVRLSANRGDVPESDRRADVLASTRTIRRLEILEAGEDVWIEIEGNAFLYRMVRMIVGSLVHVGRGRDPVEWLADLLVTPQGLQSHQTAPASGLYLSRVFYGDS